MSQEEYLESALAVVNIEKKYGSVPVLHNMQFSLKKGEIHTLLGANGAGKSTLLKIIDGVITDYKGDLYIGGKVVRLNGPSDAQKHGIGMVHQELTVLPNISVAENIFLNRLPLTPMKTVDWGKLYSDAKGILTSIGLDIDPKMMLGKLSVADMQLVEIARILSMNVPILLLDEPTSALSDAEIRRLLALMKKLQEQGKSIIFITHKLDEILDVSDRVTIMRDGYYIDTIQVEDRSPAGQRQLVKLMIGNDMEDMSALFPEKGDNFGKVALEVKNLTKTGVFSNINFYVREKEVVVITGLKGAKRTEVMRSVFGADPYTSGEILYMGQPLKKVTISNSIDHNIAMLTEDRKNEGLVLPMSVKDNISLSTINDCIAFVGIINERRVNSKAKQYAEQLRIKLSSIDQPVTSLSGGNQQKVVLAKWMAASPKILILDEPTRGIDIGAKCEIYRLVREMANKGTAVIVISSEIPEAIGMADRIYVMNSGEMVGELQQNELRNDVIMHMMFKHNVAVVEG